MLLFLCTICVVASCICVANLQCVKLEDLSVLIIEIVQIPNLVQVFLIGYYEEREFALYCSSVSNELKVPVR